MKKIFSIISIMLLVSPGCVCLSRYDYQAELRLSELRGKMEADIECIKICDKHAEETSILRGNYDLDQMRIYYEDACARAAKSTDEQLSKEIHNLINDFEVDQWKKDK